MLLGTNNRLKQNGGGNNETGTLFVSMKDCEVKNDPILSFESKRRGLEDFKRDASLYELLGYDELVLDERFARMLNPRGEICVGETMYKISPRGTYYFPLSDRKKFESRYSEYEQMEGTMCGENLYLMDTDIYRYDTFKEDNEFSVSLNNEYNEEIEFYPDTKTMPTFPSFSWSSYPTYSGPANTYLNNKKHYYYLPNNRRVMAWIYHHNYLVYEEWGSILKCQKSGLGWTAVTSKGLMITWRNLILQGGLEPGEQGPPANTVTTPIFETVEYEYQNETMVRFSGYILPSDLINAVVIGGAPVLRSIILDAVHIDIQNCKLVRLNDANTVQYFFLGTWSYGDTNLKEVKMSIGQQWGGGIPDLIGGQYMYKALDDNNNFGALRVGTAF